MKILVLGTGHLARFRARALAGDPRVTWVGVGSAAPERAAAAAGSAGAQASGDIGQMLAERPDAVVISSATSEHPAQLKACLPLGVPVLCEKPLATSLADSEAAVSLAERHGSVFQVGFQRRFDSGFRAAHERIHAGQLGELYAIQLTSHDHQPPPERYLPTRGSVFRDLHVHDFDLARWLTGEEAEDVFAVGAARSRFSYLAAHNDPDITAIILRTTGGVPILISGAQHDPVGHDVRAEIFGSHDSLAVGFGDRLALTLVDGNQGPASQPHYADFLDRFRDAFVDETRAFVDVVAGRRENPCPGAAAVEALRIALAAERSVREQRSVRLSEITI